MRYLLCCAALGMAPANAALVARFSFESDFSNSVTGGAVATVNGASTPTAGQTAVGSNVPNTGNVLRIDGGAVTPVDGLTIGVTFGGGTNASLTSLGDNFSISAWYRVDSPFTAGSDARHYVWEGNDGAGSTDYDISYNANPTTGNGQTFTKGPDTNTLITGAGTAGTWFHVTQTYASIGSNIGITTYINGQPAGSVLNSANTNATDFNVIGLNIGMFRGENRAFDGQIDEVMIYDNTLTAGQVDDLYLSQVPEPSAAMLGGFGLLALLRRRHR
ncbi:LamG-like jellyroll fold domain-containing protein [Luteolibacter sp. Populi]|uniref:LamG-like jellyroll fold domain-containing protein n=1 Tax=Luteolibacter sp. Populi TaxID=3230487 RepID=UPI0034671433